MAKEKSFAWKLTACAVAGLVVGGLGGAYLFPKEVEVIKEVQIEVENTTQIEALGADLTASQLVADGLSADLEASQLALSEKIAEVDSYSELIAKDVQDQGWMVLADDEIDSKGFAKDLKDWMNENFNLTIDDWDDMSLTLVEAWDVDATDEDREDGEAVLEGELKVKYFEDDDKDLDGKEYIKLKVVFEDNEVDEVIFEEL